MSEFNLVSEQPKQKKLNFITFCLDEKFEILELRENGDIFIKGKLFENDKEVAEAMREFLTVRGFLK